MTQQDQENQTPVPAVECLLVSVGGTPNPVAYAIDHHRPQKIIFFASRESRAEIETKIRPLTAHRWLDQEVITTPSHEDLTKCMETLITELPRVLLNLRCTLADLCVDYTGGTKTMSVAVVLATIHDPVRYSYVGGQVRTKDGLGTVLDGSEAVLMNLNPWDALAVELRRRIARQFNRGHFAEAAESAGQAAQCVSERWRPFFLALRDICSGYDRWQNFDFAAADGLLKSARPKIRQFVRTANLEPFERFIAGIDRDAARLARFVPLFQALQRKGRPYAHEDMVELVKDLAAQAERMCRLAGRPDDGVARLYSALEKLAKAGLAFRAIDNSDAEPERIPASLRDEYMRRYADAETGRLRFGMEASYRVLAALDDPLGQRYAERANDLRQVLDIRNNSLLVHGWRPVDAAVFERLFELTLAFLDTAREALPVLPELPEA